MANLSGIVKKISDLVTGTPADDDCFIFGKTDLKKITLAKLKDALGITSINSALAVKVYSGESQINGFESWAVVDNHTVTFCIRGTISNNLGTSDQYALVASFPQLKNLVTLNRLRLKRIEITPTIKGQIRFEQDTGILNIGYTYNNSGESIDIPKGVVLYLEETFVL